MLKALISFGLSTAIFASVFVLATFAFRRMSLAKIVAATERAKFFTNLFTGVGGFLFVFCEGLAVYANAFKGGDFDGVSFGLWWFLFISGAALLAAGLYLNWPPKTTHVSPTRDASDDPQHQALGGNADSIAAIHREDDMEAARARAEAQAQVQWQESFPHAYEDVTILHNPAWFLISRPCTQYYGGQEGSHENERNLQRALAHYADMLVLAGASRVERRFDDERLMYSLQVHGCTVTKKMLVSVFKECAPDAACLTSIRVFQGAGSSHHTMT